MCVCARALQMLKVIKEKQRSLKKQPRQIGALKIQAREYMPNWTSAMVGYLKNANPFLIFFLTS